jgi:acetyl-CoA C-acetyltransferase
VGLEKMTDGLPKTVSAGLATASDQDFEASHGFSFVTLSALMMRRYLHEHGLEREAFAPFPINAHRNAITNPNAMFRTPISVEEFNRSPLVSSPISVLDAAPVCDGAAAVVVCSREMLRKDHEPVRIVASAAATDTIALGARLDVITLESARQSAGRCFEAAGMKPDQMDLFEAHDAFSIITALSLEACGFAQRGEALRLAESGDITRSGSIPLSTFGGLKARGHPVGASGTYQIVEASLQLRGRAGDNQLDGARRALTQSIGGHGSVAVTHILEAWPG